MKPRKINVEHNVSKTKFIKWYRWTHSFNWCFVLLHICIYTKRNSRLFFILLLWRFQLNLTHANVSFCLNSIVIAASCLKTNSLVDLIEMWIECCFYRPKTVSCLLLFRFPCTRCSCLILFLLFFPHHVGISVKYAIQTAIKTNCNSLKLRGDEEKLPCFTLFNGQVIRSGALLSILQFLLVLLTSQISLVTTYNIINTGKSTKLVDIWLVSKWP